MAASIDPAKAENHRNKKIAAAIEQSGQMAQSTKDYYNTHVAHIHIIHNISAFLAYLTVTQRNDLVTLLEQSALTGVHFIFVSAHQDYPRGMDKIAVTLKSITSGITFTDLKDSARQILPVPAVITKIRPLIPGEAYAIRPGSVVRVKIPYLPIEQTKQHNASAI